MKNEKIHFFNHIPVQNFLFWELLLPFSRKKLDFTKTDEKTPKIVSESHQNVLRSSSKHPLQKYKKMKKLFF